MTAQQTSAECIPGWIALVGCDDAADEDDRGRAHELGHRHLHRREVLRLILRLRLDIERERDRPGGPECPRGRRWRWLGGEEGPHRLA
ncbi:hypothetical protein L1787_13345 [Acuticoccus sp. M5D2P5]|uniref:hypothetical protein n=1 Tax=Acuticoccus kalidii TaxID=2910977 RepID=UPI001F30C963|nr:hypothetical protein [Acuticoccus kalidii]MCF3934390.1 hypothetical protein [Acuticoccus kalidii]